MLSRVAFYVSEFDLRFLRLVFVLLFANLISIVTELKDIANTQEAFTIHGNTVIIDVSQYINPHMHYLTDAESILQETNDNIKNGVPKSDSQKQIEKYQARAIYATAGFLSLFVLLLLTVCIN